MSDRFFFDSNILVYSFDVDDEGKRSVALGLVTDALTDGNAIISYQVVQEVLNVISRKFESKLNPTDRRRYLEKVLIPLCGVNPSVELYRLGLDVRDETGYSFYDALIIASAKVGGCDTIYTEDLQAGREVLGMAVVNPFADA